MDAKELYEMKLHEAHKVTDEVKVVRVPGGWVYTVNRDHHFAMTFVPHSKEFCPVEPKQ